MVEREDEDLARGSHSGSLALEVLGLPGVDLLPVSSLLPSCFHLCRHLSLSRTKLSQSITRQVDQ